MELIAEYLALVLLVIMTIFFYEKECAPAPWLVLYRWCLVLPAFSVFTNIISVMLMGRAEIPHWLQMTLNSVYFMLCVLSCSVMALFLFQKILEHVYDKDCMKRTRLQIGFLVGAFFALVLCNLWTGWLFWVDDSGQYHRGVLNSAGYLLLLCEAALVLACYYKHRRSVSRIVSRALKTAFGIGFVLVLIQLLFPNILLNGTALVYADIIFFIHFQAQKVGFDTVTGLENRNRFGDELKLRLNSGQQFQVILIHIKSMNVVNQKYGSKAGDELLYSIGDALERSGDETRAFRFANVSFVVLCPYWDGEQARINLQHIQELMEREWNAGAAPVHADCGFAELIHRDENWSPTDVLDFLDYMLWYIKKEPVKLISFDREIEGKVHYRNEMLVLLKNAIEEKDFLVWFQPVYDLPSGSFHSAEALVRMHSDKYGLISPGIFIPLAEETGNIDELNWIVLEKVCSFLKAHPGLPLKTISVNISMPQLLDEKFQEKLEQLLERYGVQRSKICLEMTERVTLSDGSYVRETMEKAQKRGIEFYLDDFGVGYSNLTSALKLPYKCIKLDKSLMDDLNEDEHDCQTVKAITDVFHDIGKIVVAEGIETKKQAQRAGEIGIDRIQGYYYAKPMCGGRLLEFLEQTV